MYWFFDKQNLLHRRVYGSTNGGSYLVSTVIDIYSFLTPRRVFWLYKEQFSCLKMWILLFWPCFTSKNNASWIKRFNPTKNKDGKLSRSCRNHFTTVASILWQATNHNCFGLKYLFLKSSFLSMRRTKVQNHFLRSVCLQRVY